MQTGVHAQMSLQLRNVLAARTCASVRPYFAPIEAQVSPETAVYVATQVLEGVLAVVELEVVAPAGIHTGVQVQISSQLRKVFADWIWVALSPNLAPMEAQVSPAAEVYVEEQTLGIGVADPVGSIPWGSGEAVTVPTARASARETNAVIMSDKVNEWKSTRGRRGEKRLQ